MESLCLNSYFFINLFIFNTRLKLTFLKVQILLKLNTKPVIADSSVDISKPSIKIPSVGNSIPFIKITISPTNNSLKFKFKV